jgi:DNA-binding CsgD family transcriptional regulator
LESGAAAGLRASQLDDLVRSLLHDLAPAEGDSPLDDEGEPSVRDLVDAWLAAAEPDHERAVVVLADVIRMAEGRIGMPYLASLEGLLARSLASLSRRAEAIDVARRARARLERWPGWRRDELESLLARLEAAGDGELTAREREVAALLADGLTNAELARRLYISPRTAAVHVSNILMKLGMANRAEVAAWAVRTGVARGPAA